MGRGQGSKEPSLVWASHSVYPSAESRQPLRSVLQAGKQRLRSTEFGPGHTKEGLYSTHCLLPGTWTSHNLSTPKRLWSFWPGFQGPGRWLVSLFT